MTRFAAAVVAVAVTTSPQSPSQEPAFRTRTDLIEVAAVASDDRGTPVNGLTRADFEVKEDGRIVSIVAFAPPAMDEANLSSRGRFIILLLDDLAANPIRTTSIKNIARMFAERMGPRDIVAVTQLNGSVATTSTNRAQVLTAIDRFKPAGKTAMPFDQVSDHALDTIADLAHQVSKMSHRRKTLVWIGSSAVFDPEQHRERRYSVKWAEASRDVSRANVSVYAIDPIGLTGDRHDDAVGFARETGGVAFVDTNFFGRSVEQIWNEAEHYYLLGYEPPQSRTKSHTIEVSVRRPGVHVRARRVRF